MPADAPSAVEERVRDRFREDPAPLADPLAAVAGLLREEDPLLSEAELGERARRLAVDLVGLGALQVLLDDPDVTDVLANGPGEVWVERRGRLERSTVVVGRTELMAAIERLVAPLGLRADPAHPVVDARLADGTRVSVVLDPLAVDGPVLAIRRHRSREVSLESFCPAPRAAMLSAAVRDGHNIVVHGPTGSGKTTLVNALAAAIAETERVIVIEDVAELRLPCRHQVRLETRPPTAEGHKGVRMADLVRAALRLRPDRIVVGEVRGAEAVDMVWAMSTGHRGCMSTVHANGAADALRRVETMMLLGLGDGVPLTAIHQQVVSAVDLLVEVRRGSDGGRRVTSVHRCTPAGLEAL